MCKIDFNKIFDDIQKNYEEYKSTPQIFNGVISNKPSVIKGECNYEERIYNLATGGLYVSIKSSNVWCSFHMYDGTKIKDFHFVEYEGEKLNKIKYSIGVSPKFVKTFNKNIESKIPYLFIRYLSDNGKYDFDNQKINEKELIKFINLAQEKDINSILFDTFFCN